MEPGLPRSRNDAGRRRPPRAPRHHLRDECRKLSAAHGYRAKTRSEEHTSELQSLMRISYAAFCLKKKHTSSSIPSPSSPTPSPPPPPFLPILPTPTPTPPSPTPHTPPSTLTHP